MLLRMWTTSPNTWRTCNIWQCYSGRLDTMQSNWQPWSLSVGFLLKLAAKLLKTIRYAVCLHEMGCTTAIKREEFTTVSLSIHNVSTHSHPDITVLVDWAQKSYWLTGHENVTGWLGTNKLPVDWAGTSYWLTGHKKVTCWLGTKLLAYLLNPQSLKPTMSQPTVRNLSDTATPPQFNPFPALRAWYLGQTLPILVWHHCASGRTKIPGGGGRGRRYLKYTDTTRTTPALRIRWAVMKATFNVSLIVRDKVTGLSTNYHCHDLSLSKFCKKYFGHSIS